MASTTPKAAMQRVLQAGAVEAHGRPGAYVTRELVMERADLQGGT